MKRTTWYTHAMDEARTELHETHGVPLADLAEDFDRIHALAVEVGAYEDRLTRGPVVSERELRDMKKASRFLFLALTGLAAETPQCYGMTDDAHEAIAGVFADLLDAAADSCQTFMDAGHETVEAGAAR